MVLGRAVIAMLLLLAALTLAAPTKADEFDDCNADDPDRVIRGCSQIVGRGSKRNRAAAYYIRGNAHLDKGKYDKAIADFTQAIRLKPDFAFAYNNRGIAHSDQGDHAKAIADLTEAIRLKPDFAAAYNERGIALADKGDYDRAISDYTEAIRLEPDDAAAYSNRAWAFFRKNSPQKGLADIRKALRLNSNDKYALDTAGHILLALGRIDGAIAAFEKLENLGYHSASSHYGRAQTHELRGNFDRARDEYQYALTVPEKSETSAWARGNARRRLARLKDGMLDKRVALVIGNARYDDWSHLNNPASDADKLGTLLTEHGFKVTRKTNLNFLGFSDTLADFAAAARGADIALVYYAGHGMELAGKNILAPTDMPDACAGETLKRAIRLNRVFEAIKPAKRRIVLLDACRNDPFPRCPDKGGAETGGFRGLGRIVDMGTLFMSATVSGGRANDGIAGQGSPFTRALLRRLSEDPKEEFREVFALVAEDVAEATRGQQVPEVTLRGAPPRTCLAGTGCRR